MLRARVRSRQPGASEERRELRRGQADVEGDQGDAQPLAGEEGHHQLRAGAGQGPVASALPQPFTTSDARQALGTTRRVVIPLLEHLDARGWTRRLDAGHREVVR